MATTNADTQAGWRRIATATSANYPVTVTTPTRHQYAITDNDTAPAADFEGHLFATGRSNAWVLSNGKRLWIAPASGDRTKVVVTAG